MKAIKVADFNFPKENKCGYDNVYIDYIEDVNKLRISFFKDNHYQCEAIFELDKEKFYSDFIGECNE